MNFSSIFPVSSILKSAYSLLSPKDLVSSCLRSLRALFWSISRYVDLFSDCCSLASLKLVFVASTIIFNQFVKLSLKLSRKTAMYFLGLEYLSSTERVVWSGFLISRSSKSKHSSSMALSLPTKNDFVWDAISKLPSLSTVTKS